MTATRTKVDEIAAVELTPLPEVTNVVSVGVVHASRQHRRAIAALVEESPDLELVLEVDPTAIDELARAMPDVAVVDAAALGRGGIADLVARFPAVELVAVADDDGDPLADALLSGALSTCTTLGGYGDLVGVIWSAHHRRASVTRGAAAALAALAQPGDLPSDESRLLDDLAAGLPPDAIAETSAIPATDLAARVATAIARLRRARAVPA